MLGEGVRTAFELLGISHRTVCYVEREAAAAGQLATLMEAGALHPAPIWSDLLTFDGAAWRGCVDLVVAGFPCQDLSIAGRRVGLDGKRSGLFFDVLDIADDCGALGLVLENVSGIATATASVVDEAEGALEERAAARVLGELAERGWDAEWITLSASEVGASHGRARWFCVAWRRMADAGCVQRFARSVEAGPGTPEATRNQDHDRHRGGGGELDDAIKPRLPHTEQPGKPGKPQPRGRRATPELPGAQLFAPGPLDHRWPGIVANRPDLAPAVEPGVCMLADGMAYLVDESRAHQLRQVGNGVVPLQAAVAVVELLRRAGVGTDMTAAEARWRAQRTQQLLSEGLGRFEAMAQVREEAKSQPWMLLNK